VGGHGVTGSADPFQVGVILGYPSERADPFGQEEASVIDASVVAEGVTKLPASSSEQASPRQPPTVSDTTAAAFPSSTLAWHCSCHTSQPVQSHQCHPTTSSFQSHQRLKERNKPLFRWKSFAFHKLVW